MEHFHEELLAKLKLEGDPPYKCNSCRYEDQDKEKIVLHLAFTHKAVVEILEESDYEEVLKTLGKSSLQMEKHLNPATRKSMPYSVKLQWIVKECVEEMISVTYLANKWGCSYNQIRTWVQRAGLTVPEQKSVAIYPESPFRPKKCKLGFCHMELLRSSTST